MWVVPVSQMYMYVFHWSESLDSSDRTYLFLCRLDLLSILVVCARVLILMLCVHLQSIIAPLRMCVCVCMCEKCPADMWFMLVLFDVFIRGLSPPTSTQLFDLHQSDPDHSAFVYFQRHFSFCFSAHPLALSLSLCERLCVHVQVERLLFSQQYVCQNKALFRVFLDFFPSLYICSAFLYRGFYFYEEFAPY